MQVPFSYVKPVQTGFPGDSDARLVVSRGCPARPRMDMTRTPLQATTLPRQPFQPPGLSPAQAGPGLSCPGGVHLEPCCLASPRHLALGLWGSVARPGLCVAVSTTVSTSHQSPSERQLAPHVPHVHVSPRLAGARVRWRDGAGPPRRGSGGRSGPRGWPAARPSRCLGCLACGRAAGGGRPRGAALRHPLCLAPRGQPSPGCAAGGWVTTARGTRHPGGACHAHALTQARLTALASTSLQPPVALPDRGLYCAPPVPPPRPGCWR
jgi:hypothetical protein